MVGFISENSVLVLSCALLFMFCIFLVGTLVRKQYRRLHPVTLSRKQYRQRSQNWRDVLAQDSISPFHSPKGGGDNCEALILNGSDESSGNITPSASPNHTMTHRGRAASKTEGYTQLSESDINGPERVYVSPKCATDGPCIEDIEEAVRSSEAYIDADVPRTFPKEPNFVAMKETGALKRVLTRVASSVPQGYVQGMNELAAVLLLHFDEGDATRVTLRVLYAPRYRLIRVLLTDPTAICEHFDAFILSYLPAVGQHLKKLDVSSVYFSDWFKTVFLHVAPLDEAIVIFDAFMKFGWVAVYRVGLHILKALSATILAARDMGTCMMAIRKFRYDPGLNLLDWVQGTAAKALDEDVDPTDCQWMTN